jgi:hypothetical protein
MEQDHPRYSEVLVYQQRLIENIKRSRLFGDTDTQKAERSKIIHQLNLLSLAVLGTPFNNLCGLGTPTTIPEPSERLRPEYDRPAGPGVAALVPPGSWRLCYEDWDSIRRSLDSMCSTTLDADLLQQLVGQVVELFEEAISPLVASRTWSSWRKETENRVLELAAFQSNNRVVSALHRQAVDMLVAQLVAAAERLYRLRKWESASVIAHLATVLDPACGSAIEIKRLAKSNFDETRKALERMYINAQKALNAGRRRDAEQILLSVLREDPYYCDVKLLLEQIQRSKQ